MKLGKSIVKMEVNIQNKNVQNKTSEMKNGICLPSQLKTRLSSVFVAIWRVRRRIFFISKVVAIVVRVSSGGVFEFT